MTDHVNPYKEGRRTGRSSNSTHKDRNVCMHRYEQDYRASIIAHPLTCINRVMVETVESDKLSETVNSISARLFHVDLIMTKRRSSVACITFRGSACAAYQSPIDLW